MQWCVSYTVEVFQQDYVQAVQKLFREYTGYIRARLEGTDGEMAQITCNYPVNQDEIHAKSMEEQKSIWFSGAQIRPVVHGMELALALDRRTWYNRYERNTIEKFAELYWKENGIGGWELKIPEEVGQSVAVKVSILPYGSREYDPDFKVQPRFRYPLIPF